MRQAFPPPFPNLRSRCHQTVTTLTDATVVEKKKRKEANASPVKGHEGREGFQEEALSKLKSNGQLEVKQQACL